MLVTIYFEQKPYQILKGVAIQLGIDEGQEVKSDLEFRRIMASNNYQLRLDSESAKQGDRK